MRNIRVAAALILQNDTCLAAKRGEGRALAGYYELPGGKIEEGEDPAEACIRETAEELQCAVYIERFFLNCTYDYTEQDIHLDMDVFICRLKEGESIKATEHSDLRFVTAEEIDGLNFAPADLQFLPQIKELLLLERRKIQCC